MRLVGNLLQILVLSPYKSIGPLVSHHFRTGRVIQDIKFRANGQEDFDLSVLNENGPTQRFPLQTWGQTERIDTFNEKEDIKSK